MGGKLGVQRGSVGGHCGKEEKEGKHIHTMDVVKGYRRSVGDKRAIGSYPRVKSNSHKGIIYRNNESLAVTALSAGLFR